MKLQIDIPSISPDNFKVPHVQVLNVTLMLKVTEKYPYPKGAGESLTLDLSPTFPPRHVNEFILLRERKLSLSFDKSAVVLEII